MGWQPAFRAEGQIYANYLEAYFPERTIAVLWQNDQFGRDLYLGLEEKLGDGARRIVADMTFNISDKSVDRQIDILQASGAKILVFDGAPAIAALAIRRAADIGWHSPGQCIGIHRQRTEARWTSERDGRRLNYVSQGCKRSSMAG
jgi:ABC-type branched-subunit amino acid transport system substrate-binding protein